jgi:hypothetical protein
MGNTSIHSNLGELDQTTGTLQDVDGHSFNDYHTLKREKKICKKRLVLIADSVTGKIDPSLASILSWKIGPRMCFRDMGRRWGERNVSWRWRWGEGNVRFRWNSRDTGYGWNGRKLRWLYR